MGDPFRRQGNKFSGPNLGRGKIQDIRPGQRSKIRIKSEQPSPPFKRYGNLPPEIPWPDPIGKERRILGENWREQLKAQNAIGQEQPAPEYRQTEREAQRAARSKTGPGKIAKALKTAVQLPGLPDGSPPKGNPLKLSKLRSGPPRAIGGLGIAIEVWKDRERIWAEASRGQFGHFFDDRVFKSWLTTQPAGTTIPGDLPVAKVLGTFISDVGTRERIEIGNSISCEEYAWRKGTDGYWHLVPAPPSQIRSYQQFIPKEHWPRWEKDTTGHWRLVSGKSKGADGQSGTPSSQTRNIQKTKLPPPAFAGSRASGTVSFGGKLGIPGIQHQVPKPKFGISGPGSAAGFNPPKTTFGGQSQQGGFGKNKTIFDKFDSFGTGIPKPGGFKHTQTGFGGHQTGIGDVVSGIRSKFRPHPVGGRLTDPGTTFGGSSFGTHTVHGGEVLSRIANRYGTTVDAFAKENPWLHNRHGKILKGVDYIRPGDKLKIPGFNR